MVEHRAHRGNGLKTRKPRILFLPMEGRGLGHLSRCCKLARSLQNVASCMIGTGIRYAGNMVPEMCEYIRIPGLDGLFESRAAERGKVPFIDISQDEGIRFRQALLSTLEATFQPDLIVTDLLPAGNYSELGDILKRSRAKKFILFRSIVGTEGLEAIGEFGLKALSECYDALLIASDPRVSQVDQDLHFGDRERAKSHYIGYVSIPVSRAEIEAVRLRRGLKPGDRWVVCSAGSGFYSAHQFEDCMNLAEKLTEAQFDIVLGPSRIESIPSAKPSVFFNGRVRILTEEPDLHLAHAAADVVISHGGYNTLTEVMEGGAPLILDLRNDPCQERPRHARQLQDYYPISICRSGPELEMSLRGALANQPARRSIRQESNLKFDGCEEFKRIAFEHLGISTSGVSSLVTAP